MDRSIDLLESLDQESEQAFELNRRGYVFFTADPTEASRLLTHANPARQFVDSAPAIRERYPFVTLVRSCLSGPIVSSWACRSSTSSTARSRSRTMLV